MTAAWILLVSIILFMWFSSWHRKQEEIKTYQLEIKRLRQTSGGLEQSLETRGRRLDVLLSAVNEVVMRVDRSGRVMAANQRARELFDFDSGPLLPQSMVLFYRDSDWHRAYSEALKGLPETAQLPDIEIAGRMLLPRLAPLGSDQALLMCVDMTDIHKLEAQRRTFLSNLMHDLKTPLTSLLGYARSLESFGDDADFRKEAAQVIADEAKHVNHLLDALLTLDQIEFSDRDEDATCLSMDVVQLVCNMLMPVCEEKHIELDCDYGANDAEVAIADDELERIVTNLLSNAVNYSPEGSQVRLSLVISGSHCSIVIEDQGAGIPEKEISRVTERFYRVDKARTRKNGGHGLGLAIVKELAEKNRGELKLSNRSDQSGGLRAEVILPLA